MVANGENKHFFSYIAEIRNFQLVNLGQERCSDVGGQAQKNRNTDVMSNV